jgi:hypothetical protein
MNWGTLLAALTLSLWIAGCGEEDDAPLCTPGASVACVGPAGCAGAQVCNTEGTELGACSCGPGPDGGPRDMGTDGGIGDSGTHDTGTEDSGTQDSGTLDSGTQDSGTNDTGPDDSGTNEDAAVGPCNLVAQTGCEVGERCTWIEDIDNEGHAQCVIDGTVQPLAPCVPAGAGAPDDCVAGHVCLAGTCQEICTTVDGCGGDFACTPYLGFGDDETTGVCDPRCDPVSQTRLYDDAPACGSPNPGAPSRGCYGYLNGPFTCVPVALGAETRTHGTVPIGTANGPVLNGCAPGHLPFSTDLFGVYICRAICAPVESVLGSSAQRQGAAPHTCPARGATASTAECRFSSLFTPNPTDVVPGVGICLDTAESFYDHDMDAQTDPIPWPSCATLTSDDANEDGLPDHVSWGCGPHPTP